MADSTSPQRMTRAELIAQLEAELAGVRRMKRARNLAPELMRRLGLFPEGVEWILWLGNVHCRCNAEAVVDWIEIQFEDPALAEATSPAAEIDLLVLRLRHRLAVMEGSVAC